MNQCQMMGRNLLSVGVQGGDTQDGYVSDGLILRLDGINNTRHGHDTAVTSVWEDLSGNDYDFILYNGSPIIYDNHIDSNRNVNPAWYKNESSALNDELLAYDGHQLTIEYVFRKTNDGIYQDGTLFEVNAKDNWWCGVKISCGNPDENNVYYNLIFGGTGTGIRYSAYFTDLRNIHSYSIAYEKIAKYSAVNATAYQDNAQVQTDNGINDFPRETYIKFLYGYLPVKFYSFRIYNRILTEEERTSNYLNDKQRFGF